MAKIKLEKIDTGVCGDEMVMDGECDWYAKSPLWVDPQVLNFPEIFDQPVKVIRYYNEKFTREGIRTEVMFVTEDNEILRPFHFEQTGNHMPNAVASV